MAEKFKTKNLITISIFIISFALCFYFILHTNKIHGNLKIFRMSPLITVLVISFMNLFVYKNKNKHDIKEMSKIGKYILRTLTLLVAAAFIYFKPYSVEAVSLSIFLIVITALYVFKIAYRIDEYIENDIRYYVYFISGIMILFFIIIPSILFQAYDIKAVSEAEIILESEGYTDITYVNPIEKEKSVNIFFKEAKPIDTKKGRDLKAYIFEAVKDGKKEAIILDIMGAKMLAHDAVEKTNIEYYRE